MENSVELRKIQQRIYKVANKYCSNIYRDTAWQHVHELINIISNVEGVKDISVKSGQYFNYINKHRSIDPAYRDYETKILTDFGVLSGYIRCCAAGTAEDEFSAYDIVFNFYPSKEAFEGKRVLINKNQLHEIMDTQKTQVSFTGNNANEMGTNAQEKYNDATKNGIKPNSIAMAGKSPKNNAPDNDETIIGLDTTKTNMKDAVSSAANKAVQNGADINKISIQGNAEDINNGLGEGKVYSKKLVEEARLRNMRATGTIYSKKQLRESFLTNEDIASEIANKSVITVFNAYSAVLGDTAELSTEWDVIDAIVRKYNEATPEQQLEFRRRLNNQLGK